MRICREVYSEFISQYLIHFKVLCYVYQQYYKNIMSTLSYISSEFLIKLHHYTHLYLKPSCYQCVNSIWPSGFCYIIL